MLGSRHLGARDLVVALAISTFIIFGLVLLWIGATNLWRAHASEGWPKVPGVVLVSRTSTTTTRDRKTHSTSITHSAEITFAYTVAGRPHSTNVIRFGQTEGSSDSSEAQLLHLRYPVGRRVRIAHDPEHPEVAVVRPGLHEDLFWLPGVGLGLVLPGVMGLLFYFSHRRQGSELKWGLRIFALVFCVIGAAMLAGGAVEIQRGLASERWPSTKGTIRYAHDDVTTSVQSEDDGSTHASTSYSTALVFQYSVAGFDYLSNIRRYGALAGSSPEWAAEIAARYPEGSEVTVTYDPDDPERGVLEPGIDSEAWWLPGAGLALLSFGLAVLLFGVRALDPP